MTDLILNIKIGPFLDEKRGHIMMTIDGDIATLMEQREVLL
jgi:hypothetical protein